MAKFIPYLFFKGNCKEAMDFYKEALEGELEIMTAKDAPKEYQTSGKEDWVMHSSLKSKNVELDASDWMMEGEPKDGTNFRICIACDSPEEAKQIWEKLSEGGNIYDPLSKKFFGLFGSFTDKFGVRWMVQAELPK